MAAPPFAPAFAGWSGPWEFADPMLTADRLRAAGFVEVETGLEAAPTTLPDASAYRAFLASVIFGAHLARLPDATQRDTFLDTLTAEAAGDTPPVCARLLAAEPGGTPTEMKVRVRGARCWMRGAGSVRQR